MTGPARVRESHPSSSEIWDLFLSPWVPVAGCPAVVHLVERCPACIEETATLWARRFSTARDQAVSEEGAPAPLRIDESFDQIFDRVHRRVVQAQADLAGERAEAARLLPRLLDQPLERQIMLVANSRVFQTWSVCELLLSEAWGTRFKEPRRTEALCRVAVAASGGLPSHRYGPALTQDFQARCLIGLANGRRILGDLRGAEAALLEAHRLLAAGTGSPLEYAGWLDIRASLLIAQRKYREAEECIGRAIQTYFQFGEKHALGAALIKRGLISEAIDQADRAIVLSRAGLELVDLQRDPSFVLGTWLNLTLALHHAGRDRDALATLAQARPLYLQSDDRTTVLRFQWAEGSIASSLGRNEQAEGCLREAREGFFHLGAVLEAALISLDLAGLHLRQGRTAEVRELAAQMIAVFESLDSRQEALAAFVLLRQAAERDRVTEALLQQIGGRLRASAAHG